MDPDVTLARIRAAIDTGQYEDAAEYFEALDEWLLKKGFLPKQWEGSSPNPDHMIRVENCDLTMVLDQIEAYRKAGQPIYRMRVSTDGQQVKFKFNEGVWSPPVGKKQEPY